MIAAVLAVLLVFSLPALARDIPAYSDTQLAAAIRAAVPGDRILLGAGPYTAGIYVKDVKGTAEKPIRIAGPGPERHARINPKHTALQFSRSQYLILENLHIVGAAHNGVNFDDGGDVTNFPAVSHHITLRNLLIEDTGPAGTANAVKISGISDFLIENCTFQRWGEGGGAGIDGVGVANGVIRGCRFLAERGSTGIQLKGGSHNVKVVSNVFDNPAPRGINVGGSTGMPFFRPKPMGFEAKDITVEGNLFIGCEAAVAFPGTDGAWVRFNTIYVPRRWAFRILQETTGEDFVPSRNVVIEDNLIVFKSTQWFEGGINIGPNTDAKSYRFARNAWFCLDQPGKSTPRLPSTEVEGVYGTDPLFVDAARGDFRLKHGSKLANFGHTARRLPQQSSQ